MRLHRDRRDPVFWLLILLVAFLLSDDVWAGGECNGHDNCNETEINALAGDNEVVNSTGGNRSLALGNSLGDVDIAGCLGSTQWSTPLIGKQKLVLNHVCMAEFYLNARQYDLAAMALCNVPEILAEFKTESECEAAHDFAPPTITEASPEPHVPQDEFYRLEQLNAERYDSLAERLETIEQRPEPRPKVVLQPAPTAEPFIDDTKRAALLALMEDEDEDQ